MSRYQLLAPLGAGGSATVYRALHGELGLEVALKVIPLRDDAAERFQREVRAALSLAHPGCVRVVDAGRWDATHAYVAMELLQGPSLRQVLRDRGPLPVRLAMTTLAQIVDALAHAHRRGILHRDVKPENIMYRADGRPVLIDFGLAQPEDAAALTAVGFCSGSPSYVAPERLLGRPHRAASDVYAAGVVGYELLTGARPFRGDSPIEIARAALGGVSVPLRARAPHVPSGIAAFLERAMSRDAARRPSDAGVMAAALDAARRRAAADDDATIPARLAAW
jgi:serine/threonine protein kinase